MITSNFSLDNSKSLIEFQRQIKEELSREWNKEQGFHLSSHYLDRFLHLRCVGDLVGNKLFPNSKEITESMAAYYAVLNHLNPDFSDSNTNLIVVGDGKTPRTAALFAFRTNWQCFSIDPQMNDKKYDIRNLSTISQRIEDIVYDFSACEKVIIIAVHSHADLQVSVNKINAKHKAVIAIPCCKPQILDQKPDLWYIDNFIHSPEKAVYVWKDYK